MSQQTSPVDRLKPVVARAREAVGSAAGMVGENRRLRAENKLLRKQLRSAGASAPAKQAKPGPPAAPRRVTRPVTGDEKAIVDAFHVLYQDIRKVEKATYWLGTRVYKTPMDLWMYQELLHELKPDLLIETGTLHGGSAKYLATLMDLIGKGEIVSIDIASESADGKPPEHPRVTYVTGSSVDPGIVAGVAERAKSAEIVLVLLDSDHRKRHVLEELRAYGPLVTPGSYMVVEDTNINGHPTYEGWGEGPWEAVETFMQENDDFVIDHAREKFLLTYNPNGWLRRK
jgi:cephalosporin hydroxylase